jgi:hypothetical protein
VVVARGKGREVAQAVQRDGVLGGREADGTGVARDGARGDVVGRLGTDEEAVAADDSVGGEGGALGVSASASERCARKYAIMIGRARLLLTLNRSTVARVWSEGCL